MSESRKYRKKPLRTIDQWSYAPGIGPSVPRTWREQARAVLDAIGGAGDE